MIKVHYIYKIQYIHSNNRIENIQLQTRASHDTRSGNLQYVIIFDETDCNKLFMKYFYDIKTKSNLYAFIIILILIFALNK